MSPARRQRWSQRVTETSDALDLEPGVFALADPRAIAVSLKRSAERSRRRKADPFRSAMSMLTFYVNRAGSQLPAPQRARLEAAKDELRALFGRPRQGRVGRRRGACGRGPWPLRPKRCERPLGLPGTRCGCRLASMPRTPLDDILELPIADRLRAVEEIWESIVAAPETLALPEGQCRELERRLKLHQEDPQAAESWESIRSRLLGRE